MDKTEQEAQKALLVDLQYHIEGIIDKFSKRGMRSDLLFMAGVTCLAFNASRFAHEEMLEALGEQLKQGIDQGINLFLQARDMDRKELDEAIEQVEKTKKKGNRK